MLCSLRTSFYFVPPANRTLANNGQTLLKQILISILFGSILLSACQKEANLLNAPQLIAESCKTPIDNPSGRSYSSSDIVEINYTKKVCGFLPLSKKNYWVYQDSLFNNGTFTKTQYDTLRYVSTWKSLTDSLVWWESNISVGLPDRLYATDSSLFEIEDRLFNPEFIDAKKDYSLFEGDSIRYLSHFEDNAAFGRSVKMPNAITTSAGSFNDCILFEKNARNYRLDQVYFKPGLGVIKYITSNASPGTSIIKLNKISTLVSFHFE